MLKILATDYNITEKTKVNEWVVKIVKIAEEGKNKERNKQKQSSKQKKKS